MLPSCKGFYTEWEKKATESGKKGLKMLHLPMSWCIYNFIKFSMCIYNFNVALKISINLAEAISVLKCLKSILKNEIEALDITKEPFYNADKETYRR